MTANIYQEKKRARIILIFILLVALSGGFFDYPKLWNKLMGWSGLPAFPSKPYRLGLDIAGGTSLTYRADLSSVPAENYSEAMEGLRDVVERRVNLFGVKEPRVEVAKAQNEWRLIVELAGIRDINEAIRVIGETPFLEFREERTASETEAILANQKQGKDFTKDPYFRPTPLTGEYLKKADVSFEPTTGVPVVSLAFNAEGAKIFADLTSRNVGKRLAVYLRCPPDCVAGVPPDRLLTAPVVREAIPSGTAQISGNFTLEEAKQLARRLNEGALPVPINLISQRSVGAILGQDALEKSIRAGIIGFAIVALFMILFYRISGIVAVLALLVYTSVVLAIFKIIPVTLTLAGIAGFVLSVGMAVDANILIFERTKEELRRGKALVAALHDGFSRAWPSIRDSNISTIITAIVLYSFATSIIKGFALTLLVGVLVSMFSAIFVSRTMIIAFLPEAEKMSRWWFGAKRDANIPMPTNDTNTKAH